MFPNNAQLNYWQERSMFTPDLPKLEESEYRLFFIGDDMRRDCVGYPRIMEHSFFESLAFTTQDFNYYVKNNKESWRCIPLPSTGSNFVKNAPIFGELHAIESSFIPELDFHYQNGVHFVRKRVKITLPYRVHISGNESEDGRPLPLALQGKEDKIKVLSEERLFQLPAWMYVGIPEYWEPLLDGGYTFQQVKVRQPLKDKVWLKEYYDITKPFK